MGAKVRVMLVGTEHYKKLMLVGTEHIKKYLFSFFEVR
jgi:hypothetical protein